MIMRLDMPNVDPSLRGGKVTRWLKQEGDTFGFGDVLCEVAVDEFAVLRRTARATKLTGRRRRKLKSDLEIREGKVYLELAITSADQGVLRKILIDHGAPATIGDTLAVVSTMDHGELTGSEAEWKGAPEMRSTANMMNHDDDDMTEGDS